jgi:hypothetical protein
MSAFGGKADKGQAATIGVSCSHSYVVRSESLGDRRNAGFQSRIELTEQHPLSIGAVRF